MAPTLEQTLSPRKGFLCFLAQPMAWIFPSVPLTPKPPGTRTPLRREAGKRHVSERPLWVRTQWRRSSALTLSCRASATHRGTSPAPPAGCSAPDTPSRCTEEERLYLHMPTSCLAGVTGDKSSHWAHTLTSSLWLMARAECSRALMTEA